jgi:hypothetical protein
LPTVHAFRIYVDVGGVMACGATTSEIYTSAAEQVAKILKGVRPSELPLRQATRFELVINNRTAKALRADEVIECPAEARLRAGDLGIREEPAAEILVSEKLAQHPLDGVLRSRRPPCSSRTA